MDKPKKKASNARYNNLYVRYPSKKLAWDRRVGNKESK